MSYAAFPRVMPVLTPEQISALARLFAQICEDCDEPTTTKNAAQCAATLIRSVQRGIAEEQMLIDIGHAVLRS